MSHVLTQLRDACATVAERASYVRVNAEAIPAYAASLPLGDTLAEPDEAEGDRERLAAFWLTLDAINFGSGWFPTLRKRAGQSGYHTIADALTDRFDRAGPFPAAELREIEPGAIAAVLGQDPDHELMALFAASLRDLGAHVEA